jgi:hypothetical protein
MGIPGSEMADALAKRGCGLTPADHLNSPPFYSHQKRKMRAARETAFNDWWHTNMPEKYEELGLSASLRPVKEITLPRRQLHSLLAARTGHGDFAVYHREFKHEDANLLCSCGKEKTRVHPLFCRRARAAPWMGHRQYVRESLGPNWPTFVKHVKDTGFVTKICPR